MISMTDGLRLLGELPMAGLAGITAAARIIASVYTPASPRIRPVATPAHWRGSLITDGAMKPPTDSMGERLVVDMRLTRG